MQNFIAPKWSRELVRFLSSKSQFILWGNIHDIYPIQMQDNITTLRLDAFLNATLRAHRYSLVVKYEPLIGFSLMSKNYAETFKRITGLDCKDGVPLKATLLKAAEIIDSLVKYKEANCAVILNSASRIQELCSGNGNDVNEFYFYMFRLLQEASPKMITVDGKGTTTFYSPVLWVLDKENDLPAWYGLNNARLRSLPIPKPDHDIRSYIINTVIQKLDGYNESDDEQKRENTQLFISQTAGLFASEVISIVQLARRERLKFSDIGEAIRRYKLGIMENLWAKLDHKRIKDAETYLSNSVMGQAKAVRHVANILKRSVYSLSGSQFSRYSQRPKGVLFFAGATGVGKTELAKAITELVFGSPTNYIRFDMSEFGHEQADQRLVGAPPGYVGYDVGGELTNAVKQNPFSIILFDEIEKANPKILDIFLQILDDGRLTSGRGETVYFSESLIIFTSNLGIYELKPDGTKHQVVTPDMPYDEISEKIVKAIDDFFRYKINRPEILNRIGKNITVFDFIRKDTAEMIFDKMLGNIAYRLKDSHNIELELSENARKQILSQITADLSMGGRGIGNTIEEVLINPLSRSLFENSINSGSKINVTNISEAANGWELNVSVS